MDSTESVRSSSGRTKRQFEKVLLKPGWEKVPTDFLNKCRDGGTKQVLFKRLIPIRLRQMLEADILPVEMHQGTNGDGSASTKTEDPRLDQSLVRVNCDDRGA